MSKPAPPMPVPSSLLSAVQTTLQTAAALQMAPPESRRQQVGIGEVKVGAAPAVLQAILGSCVAIGLIWRRGGRCGLAHCLLPEAPGPAAGIGGRYVSQAIPSLLMMMGLRESDYPDVEVVVAGGASMLKGRSPSFQVGDKNAAAAQKYLAARGLQHVHYALGGRSGRQISIDCGQHSFLITDIAGQNQENHDGRV